MAEPGWDQSKFDAALERYMATTKRDFPGALNKKGYYVARKAIWFTEKADYGTVRAELGTIGFTIRIVKSGKRAGKFGRGDRIYNTADMGGEVPLIAAIINARRGRAGEPGLYGSAMSREAQRVFGARARADRAHP